MTEPGLDGLRGKRITLGVTGSIAAYKAPAIARLLVKAGAKVEVVMTAGATHFVGASTFAGIIGRPVSTEMFDARIGGELHVALAKETDLLLVAPATADFIARLEAGRADDLLAATALSATCPVLVAPAMHPSMWSHPATVRNVAELEKAGRVGFVGPVDGDVASGDRGLGRMMEPEEIVKAAASRFAAPDLDGRRIVVTAGPTVEDIDPVRFIGNRSSGKMGFSIAERASARGATVTLVAGPVSLSTPRGVKRVDVRSALDMRAAVRDALGAGFTGADSLVMCAAVGDFRPETALSKKLKRGGRSSLDLRLVQNPDILAEIGRERRRDRPVLVGFALETGTDREIARYARKKLAEKRVDVVIANPAGESMGLERNRILIVGARSTESLEALPKLEVADRILDWIAKRIGAEAPGGRGARVTTRARKRTRTRK